MDKIELVKFICRTIVSLGIGTIIKDIGKQSLRNNPGIIKKITVGTAVFVGTMIISDKTDKYVNNGIDKLSANLKETLNEEPVEKLS